MIAFILTVAFLAFFLLGCYTTFRICEHYNHLLREQYRINAMIARRGKQETVRSRADGRDSNV